MPDEAALEQQLRSWTRTVETQIVANPLVSLGVAVALGVFLGWIIKRR
jgi:ElaB/YqjD/DUF883 family membrane-anchored ribosome-binding protein